MKLPISLVLLFSLIANCIAFAAPVPAEVQARQKFEPSEKAWKWADKQLKKMSADEKVGQLVHIGVNARFANQDSAFFKALRHDVVDNKIGGIIFFGAPIYETAILANRMAQAEDYPRPITMVIPFAPGGGRYRRFAGSGLRRFSSVCNPCDSPPSETSDQ